jgi:hypothetical protein
MKNLTFSFLFLLILSSCEKDNQLIVENSDIPLITKILIGDETYMEYSYDRSNLVIEEKSKLHYTKHNYNDRNLLISSEYYLDPGMFSSSSYVVQASLSRTEWVNPDNTAKSLTRSFDYDGDDRLTRITYTRPSANNNEYCEYKFEDSGIIRQTMFWQGSISGYIDYVYDDRGNLQKETKYLVLSDGVTELMTTTEYEYDNMKNPYFAFKRLMTPGKYTNPNNIIKTTYKIHFEVDAWIEKTQVTENKYQYNRLGYPVKVNDEVTYVYK